MRVVFLVKRIESQGIGREFLERFSCGDGEDIGIDAIEKGC
jgi:hypothetical protein